MALSFNATLTNLPTVLSALSSTLASLPSGLNTSSLVSSLDAFASTSPAYSTLTSYEQQTLLSNFTWLSTQTSLLAAALEKVPSGDKDGADEGTLVAMVQLGLGRYDIETWWAPEVFGVYSSLHPRLGAELTFSSGSPLHHVLPRRVRQSGPHVHAHQQGGGEGQTNGHQKRAGVG